MTRRASNAFWVLAAWLVVAASVRGERPYDAVCRVHVPLGGMEAAGGSGTLIHAEGGRGVVITAAHVLEGGGGGMSVTFPSTGKTYPAQPLKIDQTYDLAALSIDAPEGIEPPVGVKSPTKDDEPFVRVGYPWYGQGQQHWNQGKWIGFPSENGESAWAPSMAHTTGIVVSGFSGGALFSREGYFCGVVSGTTSPDASQPMDRTWGASGDVLVKFCQTCCNGNCPVYVVPGRPRPPIASQPSQPTTPTAPAIQPSSWTDPRWEKWREQIEVKIAACKGCDCDPARYATSNSVLVEINNLRQDFQASLDKIEMPPAYVPPTPQETAVAILPHLTHSATITLPDGQIKTQTKPLNEALNFTQHPAVVK